MNVLCPLRALHSLVFLAAVVIASPASLAGTVTPDWIAGAAADTSPGFPKLACVELLSYQDIKYEPGGKIRSLSRHVVRPQTESGIAEIHAYHTYNSDTAHVLKAQAWIISPDGKKIETFGKSEFGDLLLRRDQYIWSSARVLDFTRVNQVKVGGMIAWEIELEDQTGLADASWSFRASLPTLKTVFEVTPAPGGKLISYATSPSLPASTPGTLPGSLRWEMHRHRGSDHQLPAGFVLDPLVVSVRCLGTGGLADRLQSWHAFAGVTADIIEKQIVAAPSVAEQAAALTKNKTDRWERIRSIGEFVQKQINYLSLSLDKDSLAGYRPHFPADALKARLGDCKDKASLMADLLRACGENGYVVLVYAGNPGRIRPEWPSASFNHAIVAIPADDHIQARWPKIDGGPLGPLVLFDPTDPITPFGLLPTADQAGYGLVVSSETPDIVTLPAETPEECRFTREIEGELTASGDLTAKVSETETGSNAARTHFMRANSGKDRFTHLLEARLHETMPLTRELTWKEDWDQADVTTKLTYQFAATGGVKSAGNDMLLISPRLIGFNVQHIPWENEVLGRVWLSGHTWREAVTLKIPDGFTLGNLPPNWQEEAATLSSQISYKVEGNKLTYTCQILQKPGFADRASYEALRAFYHRLDESQRRLVIASRKPAVTAVTAAK